MKSGCLSLLPVTALAMGLSAPAGAEVLFDGTMKITEVSAACTGLGANWTANASFHPQTVTGGPANQNFSSLNFFATTMTLSWVLAGASFNTTFQQAVCSGIGWSAYNCQRASYIRVTSQSPATITRTTPTVTLAGQIRNFNGQAGQENCVASFRMVGILATR